jgi:hypothetical protein
MNDLTALARATDARPVPAVERRRSPRTKPMRTRIWVAAAATLGAAVTLALNGALLLEVDHRSAPLRVAIEVTAAMASIVAAQLVYGRFRSTLQFRDLVLLLSLCLFAVTNLLF